MSFAGFKKQLNKANQLMNEKIGGTKGTEIDDTIVVMGKQIDVMSRLVEELMVKTQEMLQPNPASRAKMTAMKSMSKLRGQHNQLLYPQPEGVLGDCMLKYGRELGENSAFGQALTETGEGYKQIADFKYALEDSVRQNFIEPLLLLENKDIKEVNHHRKKLTSRRLDYDGKKRRQQKDGSTAVTEDEIRDAEEKFEESKQLTEQAMANVLENDAEQVSQLASFVEAELTFHQQSVDILQSILASLRSRCNEAAGRPKVPRVSKRSVRSTGSNNSPTLSLHSSSLDPFSSQTYTATSTDYGNDLLKEDPIYSVVNKKTKAGSSRSEPTAEALYDFEAENTGELTFKEGDIIKLKSRIDANWFEGSVNGSTGLFPVTYVKVLVDLP